MAIKPIIFSGPMVRALLDGTKTQTRRALKPQPPEGARYSGIHYASYEPDSWFFNTPVGGFKVREAYAPGDLLWVRETHRFRGGDYGDSGGDIEWYRCYGADGAPDNWDPDFPDGWEPSLGDGVHVLTDAGDQEDGVVGYATKLRPSIHMPRWASRLTLEVTDVRVQQIKFIDDLDCRAEGIEVNAAGLVPRDGLPPMTARAAFRRLWDSLNAKRGFGWDANPWVVALTFKVHRCNVDSRRESNDG